MKIKLTKAVVLTFLCCAVLTLYSYTASAKNSYGSLDEFLAGEGASLGLGDITADSITTYDIGNIDEAVPAGKNTDKTADDVKQADIIDNSDLLVKVIKTIDGVNTTVFTGKLGDYDNGAWKNTDFSKIDFLLIFDWETEEQYSIIPEKNAAVSKDKIDAETPFSKAEATISDKNIISKPTDSILSEEKQTAVSIVDNKDIQVVSEQPLPQTTSELQLIDYDITYSILTDNGRNDIEVTYSLHNGYTVNKTVTLIAAIYTGQKLNKSVIKPVTISPSANVTENITLPITDAENQSVKLMVWDGVTTIRPIGTAKALKDLGTLQKEKDIYITKNVGEKFKIFMNGNNVKGSNLDAVHTISYNPAKIQPVDLCLLTYEKEIAQVTIDNAGIEIQSVDLTNGIVKFSFKDNFIERYTGVNNIIKFEALQDLSEEKIIYTIQ